MLTPLLALAIQAEEFVLVTAAREPVDAETEMVAETVFTEEEIEALNLPAAIDLLRLSPGVSLAVTGPRGSQAQVRLRGAEANHSLLFVDGIRFNDPASGNEPRFELLTTDPFSSFEIVRGPASALWGAEAIGGVIAARSGDPLARQGSALLAELGQDETSRLYARHALKTGSVGLAAGVGYQRSEGIDAFGSGGERDGFENVTVSLQAVRRAGGLETGIVGHWIGATSEYDGFDPATFQRADTEDETRNRLGAVRAWTRLERGAADLRLGLDWLTSANRNFLGNTPLNRTSGERLAASAQASITLGRHRVTGAIDGENEGFRARDTIFFGGTDQDRDRRQIALVGDWQARWSDWLRTSLALRRDIFSAFDDATTVRGAVSIDPALGLELRAGYGEGIAQPTFFDLFGFFPGSFAGNPALRPERSRSLEVGVEYAKGNLSLAASGYRARLTDEIIDVFEPVTFISSTENATGTSRRQGLELEAGLRLNETIGLRLNYSFTQSNEQRAAGGLRLREVRRPRHSANLIAYGAADGFRWGASLSYVGERRDTNFDAFPAREVRLDDYWLGSLNLSRALPGGAELFLRVENALDDDYQDVFGYATRGRSVHAGVRYAFGD